VATRLYLRAATASNPPSNGEKSTALPVGTFSGNSGSGFENLSLSTTKGSAQTSKAINSLAQTAHQDNYIARFTSDALAAQTITAQTWTIALLVGENNANANSFTVASIYVWRPGSSSVVGFIYDSDTHVTNGSEWHDTEEGYVVTVSGGSVTAQANDVLVYEAWRGAAQAKANAYAQTLFFDGTTDIVDGVTVADAASYIETPQDLTFGAAATQPLYHRTGGVPGLRIGRPGLPIGRTWVKELAWQ
jgi:hypothetical protein